MTDFELHPQLVADTVSVATWPLCEVLLMDDANYPWLILVPRRAGLRDFHDLLPGDRVMAGEEIARASRALVALFDPVKMNVAALGNAVPQLHIHIVARYDSDPAWPGPIWGVVPAKPYDAAAREERMAALRGAFEAA